MTETKMPTVSVVVPVYNTEKWLPDCLESLRRQTYQKFEIILVDDGSTDGSGSLCDEFTSCDWRARVIHQSNKGLSAARNRGSKEATGEYILFLDSDDYLEPDAVEKLASAAFVTNADTVISGFVYSYSDHEDKAYHSFGQDVLLDNYAAMEALVSGKLPNFAWGKLIRNNLARKHLFPEGKLFEDHFWTHLIVGDAQRVFWLESALVHYRQRNDSISYTFTPDRLDMLDGWRSRIDYLDDSYPGLKETYLKFLSTQFPPACWLVLTRMKKSKNRKESFARLRSFSSEADLESFSYGKNKKLISALDRSVFSYAVTAITLRIISR